MAHSDSTQSPRSTRHHWLAAGTGLGVSLLAPLAAVAAPAWAGVPGFAPVPGGLAPRLAGEMGCTSDLDEDDDGDDLAKALNRAEPDDTVCVPLDDEDETDEQDEDQAGEPDREGAEEDPAEHVSPWRHLGKHRAADQPTRHGHHNGGGKQGQHRRQQHSDRNFEDTNTSEPRPRAMTSGERQYRTGCLHGYIAEDCQRFSVHNLLRLGINPDP